MLFGHYILSNGSRGDRDGSKPSGQLGSEDGPDFQTMVDAVHLSDTGRGNRVLSDPAAPPLPQRCNHFSGHCSSSILDKMICQTTQISLFGTTAP